jgi:hypothetical protein
VVRGKVMEFELEVVKRREEKRREEKRREEKRREEKRVFHLM